MGTVILPLSGKQYYQLLNLSKRTQSFLCTDRVTFIDLLILSTSSYNDLYLMKAITEFKDKYYPSGYRENKREFVFKQLQIVSRLRAPRFNDFYKPYEEIEKVLFLKAVRLCRDYIMSEMNEDDTNNLIEKVLKMRRS